MWSSVNLIVFLGIIVQIQMAVSGTVAPSLGASHNAFATALYKVLTQENVQKNVIFSPASIRSCMTLTFMGAEGKTADELRTGLQLGAGDKRDIAKNYGEFLRNEFKRVSNDFILKMANRIYINENLNVATNFNEIATNFFDSKAIKINFTDAPTAVQQINKWVEEQTENKINNLLTAESVNGATSLILINAIYLKAKWARPFAKEFTTRGDFYLSPNKKIAVDTMYQDDKFKYAELPEFDATAIELPYESSDISMLIILPNKLDGLKQLQQQLASTDFNQISQKLFVQSVDVFLPKFKIEFDVDLVPTLHKLGIMQLFNNGADLRGLLSNGNNQKVSAAYHKAYLDVNEAGSEAAAATYVKVVPMSLNIDQKNFRADHPFMFAIRNSRAVFFAGHVAQL